MCIYLVCINLVLTRFFNLTLTQEKASPYFWILCNIFFRWCCLTMADQVSMTPAPMISPIQFYLNVFTCAILGKESVFIFLVVRTTKRPQARWVSSLWSRAHLSRAPTALRFRVRLYNDHHVPVDMFVIPPGFCTSQFRHLQPIWVAPVIKTSWPEVEVSCLG